MKIKICYECPHSSWSINHVFKHFHDYCLEIGIECEYLNYRYYIDNNPSGIYSPHNMRIINEENGKYIVVSYWDKANDMTHEGNGWDHKNCVDFITSSGVKNNMEYTPFSYLPYLTYFSENYLKAKPFSLKENNELIFRGFLYGQRLDLANLNKIKICNDKIQPETAYYEDLTNNKMGLSLNGAGEICNRDLEILSARSVLFRPILNVQFHNKLIVDYHYIGFEYDSNPEIQMDIILKKYNEIKDNESYLEFIAENGYNWYKENGTINANVNVLKKIINFDKLI